MRRVTVLLDIKEVHVQIISVMEFSILKQPIHSSVVEKVLVTDSLVLDTFFVLVQIIVDALILQYIELFSCNYWDEEEKLWTGRGCSLASVD